VKPLPLSHWDVQDRFPSEAGAPLVRLGWYEKVRVEIDDSGNVAVVILTPRQDGKTTFLLSLGAGALLTKRNAYIVLVLPSVEQAQAIARRKLHRPLLKLARALGIEKALKFTTTGVECALTGSTFEIVAATEFTSPGRSVSLLLIDEGKGLPDAVFEALAPSIIGAGGQIIVCSTAGRPVGWLYELVSHPGEGVFIHRETENTNPFASSRVLATLERLFSWMNPAARDRELRGEFTGDGTELLPRALIEAAMDEGLGEIARSEDEAFVFYDLARRRDLASRVVVLRRAPRRPERTDHLVVASIRVWDPRAQPSGEVLFDEVRADLAELPERFPNLQKGLVDEGAEAGSLLPFARGHPKLTLVVAGFQPNAKNNMALWGSVSGRLQDQTLSIPDHPRLLAELRSLKTEMFAYGAAWRVLDGSRKLHRDVAVSLAGACSAAGERARCPAAPSPCPNPVVCPIHLWGGNPYRTTEEERAAEERERAEQSAEMIKGAIARGGAYWPGEGRPRLGEWGAR
jgi:hypothetical protein